MASRQCFLRFFAILLAIVAGLTIAVILKAPQTVYRMDVSMMTSAISALFVISTARIGAASWRGDKSVVEFGHLCVRMSVMFGIIGTVIGLSLQATSLASEGAASLGALSTSLFTTATGVISATILEILTFNLEASTKE